MRVLITGGSGFVGKHRVNHLKELGHEVIAVAHSRNDNADYSYIDDIAFADVLNPIIARHGIDRLEHYASISTVGVSRRNPYATYRTNVLGTLSVLESALEYKIPAMVFSTDKVYGYASQIADEGTFLMPDAGEYENSKTLQDMLAQSYNLKAHNISIIRSCNIFGKDDTNSRLVPNTIRALEEGKSPIIFKKRNTKRQFIYIPDLMSAIDLILERTEGHIFNIATDNYLSQEDAVLSILKVWNKKYGVTVEPEYDDKSELSELKAQYLVWEKLKMLGWSPKYTFEQGIEDML